MSLLALPEVSPSNVASNNLDTLGQFLRINHTAVRIAGVCFFPYREMPAKQYAEITKKYLQRSVRARIEALFLDNIGKVVTRAQIQEVARDPVTGRVPENWHQRLSELRTDRGYTILTARDRRDLAVSEYLMISTDRRPSARKRFNISPEAWVAVLKRANYCCEWNEAGQVCGLQEGEIDPVGGGTVRLTPDHKTPHSVDPNTDPKNPDEWQALCERHQVVKKNFWDHRTGGLNVYAVVQGATEREKREIFEFLRKYFGQ